MANKRASRKGRPYAEIGERLERFRKTIPVDQKGMCEIVDLPESGWSAFQSGARRISIKAAIRLCEAYHGLSLDWIYFGRTQGLSPDWKKLLG